VFISYSFFDFALHSGNEACVTEYT